MELTDYKRTACPPTRTPAHSADTVKWAKRARTRAEVELGRLWPKRPAGFTPSGFPLLGEGQVYATRTGYVWHPLPCADVMRAWNGARAAVQAGRISRRWLSIVVLRESVGARQMCSRCANLTDPTTEEHR